MYNKPLHHWLTISDKWPFALICSAMHLSRPLMTQSSSRSQLVLMLRMLNAIAAATRYLPIPWLSFHCAAFAEDVHLWCCSPLVASASTVFSKHYCIWNWDLNRVCPFHIKSTKRSEWFQSSHDPILQWPFAFVQCRSRTRWGRGIDTSSWETGNKIYDPRYNQNQCVTYRQINDERPFAIAAASRYL